MILVGIDDTDTLDSPGTNQLARRLAGSLPAGFECALILRHQLFFDPGIPYTSKNGSASLLIRRDPRGRAEDLVPVLEREMRAWYVPGSDPGLCIAERSAPELTAFGRRCQRQIVRREEAWDLAREHGTYLKGFGGTDDGVIGALAAVGLLAAADDGRVVHLAGWTWPDPFSGPQTASAIRARGVDEIRRHDTGVPVETGKVDIGRHLRPSYRNGRVVLFVEPSRDGGIGGDTTWRAAKLP